MATAVSAAIVQIKNRVSVVAFEPASTWQRP